MSDSHNKTWCCCCKTRSPAHHRSNNKNSNDKNADDVIAKDEDLDALREEPLRKRLLRACLTLVYVMLVAVAVVVTYSMVRELVHSLRHPVRSINFKRNDYYEAPGQYVSYTLTFKSSLFVVICGFA